MSLMRRLALVWVLMIISLSRFLNAVARPHSNSPRRAGGVMKTSGPNIICQGELLMDPDRHLCSWKGEEVKLTVTEFLILQALALDREW